jgi:Fe-S oxidoreductase
MAIDMEMFHGFLGQIKQLGSMAQPTDYSDEERVTRAKEVFNKRIQGEQAGDLEACMHCGLCAEACHFRVMTGDPKYTPAKKFELIRRYYRREKGPFKWIYKMATKDITAQDLQDWQELVYDSCTTCGRCSMICPMGINIAELVTITRAGLANAGLIPADLRAVQQEQEANGTVFGAGPEALKQAIDKMAEMGVDIPLDKEKADYLVITSVIDILLFNDSLMGTAKIFNKLGLNWTIKSCAFEGSNFGLLAGVSTTQEKATLSIINEAVNIGAKAVIIPECGHAYPALRWSGANLYGQQLPFDVFAISEFLGLQLKEGNLKLKQNPDLNITYHDPCKVGRYSGVIDEPREVFKALGGKFTETPSHGKMNWCCGGGAGVFVINSAAPLRKAAFDKKIEEVDKTGADQVVMACGSCRMNFLKGAHDAKWDKEIVSMVSMVSDHLA